ncbi:MAG: hypothetical protein M5T61_21345 [Acidimicrobiia bacterium]|nr:hypothetical protein [Acidimicrobiia bacterium]
MIDFPNTVADNDGMRTLSGAGQNEPATGLIEIQTAGHYLASAVVAFADGGQQTLAAASVPATRPDTVCWLRVRQPENRRVTRVGYPGCRQLPVLSRLPVVHRLLRATVISARWF